MKINEKQLRGIIRESIKNYINEGSTNPQITSAWDRAIEIMGTKEFLDALYAAMSEDDIQSNLEYINRMYELNLFDDDSQINESIAKTIGKYAIPAMMGLGTMATTTSCDLNHEPQNPVVNIETVDGKQTTTWKNGEKEESWVDDYGIYHLVKTSAPQGDYDNARIIVYKYEGPIDGTGKPTSLKKVETHYYTKSGRDLGTAPY